MPARGRLARCRKGPPRPLSQGAASPVVARGRLARCRKGPPRPLSQGAASPVVQSSRILVPAGCGYRKGCRIQGCPRLVLRTGGLHLSLLQGDVVNLTRTSSSGSKPAEMLLRRFPACGLVKRRHSQPLISKKMYWFADTLNPSEAEPRLNLKSHARIRRCEDTGLKTRASDLDGTATHDCTTLEQNRLVRHPWA